jgi:hypothetical protein
MRAITVSQTGVGPTVPVPMDQYQSPFNVGFGVVVSGSVTYTVQYSFDSPFTATYDPANATWYGIPDLTNKNSNQSGNIAYAVAALRLNVTAGTGTVTFTILQSGVQG